MTENDDLPKAKQGPLPPNLDTMSIFELEAHIEALHAEIERTRQMIAKKQAAKSSADSFFKS